MINYSYIARTIQMGEEEVLHAGFRLPTDGNYKVKAFVLDNFKSGKVLSDIKVIPVEK
jgi:hypothetical protein